ncbi:unnamed protein product [Amoebophrya sp. A25]|nr:unnamed protein product [Amoebophrya sp. A25]|eukprot:GSA25T00004376001.1
MTQENERSKKKRRIRVRLCLPLHWKGEGLDAASVLSVGLRTSLADVKKSHMINLLPFRLERFAAQLRLTHCGGQCPSKMTAIIDVTRKWRIYGVENWPLWQKYERARRALRDENRQQGGQCCTSIQCDGLLKRIHVGVRELFPTCQLHLAADVNEVFLFHGTDAIGCEKILTSGFDFRIAKESCLYGQGLYFASNVCKSLQYTGSRHKNKKYEKSKKHRKTEKTGSLIIARVLIGEPCLTDRVCRGGEATTRKHEAQRPSV